MITIPLQTWIERARSCLSKEDYVESAVAVAMKLTNYIDLCTGLSNSASFSQSFNFSFSSWNDSGSSLAVGPPPCFDEKKEMGIPPMQQMVVKIEDIASEHVVVTIEDDGSDSVQNLSGKIFLAASFAPITVTIQPAASISNIFETPQPSSPAVCFALGQIFFELFSQGSPVLMMDIDTTGNGDDSFGTLLLDGIDLNEDGTTSRSAKRSFQPGTVESGTSMKHLKAKAFLQDMGVYSSICQLVSDLLEVGEGNPYVSDTALSSLGELQFDLMQMTSHPNRFLKDHASPREALESTALFNQVEGELYGRDQEVNILIDAAKRVINYVKSPPSRGLNAMGHQVTMPESGFLREAIFLGGHSGSGKSSISKRLDSFCNENGWFVLSCKFDRQVVPLLVLLQLFDSFFGKHHGQDSLRRLSWHITSSINKETFGQLCDLLPNLRRAFPLAMDCIQRRMVPGEAKAEFTNTVKMGVSSPGGLGSGNSHLKYLFQVIFKALLSGGCPLLIILDDLQWADAFTVGIITELIQKAGHSSAFSPEGGLSQQGLVLLGSFRDNEVEGDGFLINEIKCMEQYNGITVTRLFLEELPDHEINRMLSSKFGLPLRHTRELSQIVYQKTRGLPMYTLEFLRSLIERNLLSFSVKQRRWIWDDTAIDMQMISDGVLDLLTKKLQKLPHDVRETLKVCSCLGFQVNLSTIQILDLGQFAPDMVAALEVGVKEGIIEKAGPIFAFSHDMLQESTYNLIPVEEKRLTHSIIGRSLAEHHQVVDNPELCMLACDQVKKGLDLDGVLDPMAGELFARLNLASGKHSIATSSFGQARGYLETGISLLHANPWDKQYSLCLELHELSVLVSFMDGETQTISSRLDLILSHARTFEDALNTRALRAKFLASQNKHADATREVLEILSKLGEEFPEEGAFMSHVLDEVKLMQSLLKSVSKETIVGLPTMTDPKKLIAMKFMGVLINLIMFSNAMLMHLLSFRMVKLTFEFGFCEDSISGLAFMSNALTILTDDVQLASRIGAISESLLSGSANEHSLRAKLSPSITSAKTQTEPFQSGIEYILSGYHSAEIVGDIDAAMLCGLMYCIGRVFSIADLTHLQIDLIKFLYTGDKHNRISVLHSVMSFFNAVTALIGNRESCSINPRIEMKTNIQLYHIAELAQNSYLMHQVVLSQMYVHCYFREFLKVAQWAEKYSLNGAAKRVLDFFYCFFEGISALCLARDSKGGKWRTIGEKAAETLTDLAANSTWNFENKLALLQAELCYLDGCHTLAELSYQASIQSAHEHRFYHEEALACESFGIFLIENNEIARGIGQLKLAIDKYKQWGATNKASDVEDFVECVSQTALIRRL